MAKSQGCNLLSQLNYLKVLKKGYSRQSCRLPDSPMWGVDFRIRISPRILSQKYMYEFNNGVKIQNSLYYSRDPYPATQREVPSLSRVGLGGLGTYEFLVPPFKGTVSRDFLTSGCFHKSVSPKPLSIPLGPFEIFSKILRDIHSSRCTTGVVDTGGKWKKSSIIKALIILFGHLWEVELTHR